jgi:hypothetical protein
METAYLKIAPLRQLHETTCFNRSKNKVDEILLADKTLMNY